MLFALQLGGGRGHTLPCGVAPSRPWLQSSRACANAHRCLQPPAHGVLSTAYVHLQPSATGCPPAAAPHHLKPASTRTHKLRYTILTSCHTLPATKTLQALQFRCTHKQVHTSREIGACSLLQTLIICLKHNAHARLCNTAHKSRGSQREADHSPKPSSAAAARDHREK